MDQYAWLLLASTYRAASRKTSSPDIPRKMKAAVNDLGDPADSTVKLGALVDEGQLERVKGMIERGKHEAELVVGGVQYGDTGCYMEPTVFLDPKAVAEIYKDEIFGQSPLS